MAMLIPHETVEAMKSGSYNCIMYALDDSTGSKNIQNIFEGYYLSDPLHNGALAFEKTCTDIKLSVQRVASLEEANLAIAWWTFEEVNGQIVENIQYHVIRKFPSGWMQKDFDTNPPYEVNAEELHTFSSGGDDTLFIAYFSIK